MSEEGVEATVFVFFFRMRSTGPALARPKPSASAAAHRAPSERPCRSGWPARHLTFAAKNRTAPEALLPASRRPTTQ